MKLFIQIFIALLIGILLAMMMLLWRNQNTQIEINKTVEDLSLKSPELITVRYTIHTLYEVKEEKNRFQFGPLGFWKIKAMGCWRLKTDVLAGYRWDSINFKKSGNLLVISAGQPEILAVDYRGSELIYQRYWSKLNPEEKEFISLARNESIKTAKELGILQDAESRLNLVGKILAQKLGLQYNQVKIVKTNSNF